MTPAHHRCEHDPASVPPRARLLVQRLLQGEGSVELTAYRTGHTLTSGVHGVSGAGCLVVAYVPMIGDGLDALHTTDPVEVRLDIVQDALDVFLPLRTASAHLLGTLRWCRDDAEVAELEPQGPVAELIADAGPRVRVGVVETDRVLLHDAAGVTAFCRHTAPLPAPRQASASQVADLADVVQATSPEVLADLADAVEMGLVAGSQMPVEISVPEAAELGPVRVADVDEHGVTLLRLRGEAASAVHLRLPEHRWHELRAAGSLRQSWRRLLDCVPSAAVPL